MSVEKYMYGICCCPGIVPMQKFSRHKGRMKWCSVRLDFVSGRSRRSLWLLCFFLVYTGMWSPSLHCRHYKFVEGASRSKLLDGGISRGRMLRSGVLKALQSPILHLILPLPGVRASRRSNMLQLRASISQ